MSGDRVGINELKRRDFLKAGLVFGQAASALAAGYAAIPDAFARAVYAAKQDGVKNDNVLVMIQLAGGNDHLRTVIPLQDPRLHDLRPILAANTVPMALPLNAQFGLNHNMPGIYGALFDTAISTAQQTIASVKGAANRQSSVKYSDDAKLVYPSKTELGAALQLAAALITGGSGVKLLHVTLGGFDTHQTELNRHNDLMGYLDQSVAAFYQDLSAHGMADKVLIATWSEFSRRPQENASGGTDHGAASAVLLMGDPVQGGFYGQAPSLGNLDSTGNLRYTVDFRSVYQEILNTHLGADAH